MLRNILTTLLAIALVGCGSTNKTVNTPTVPTNKGVEKLVRYGILEPELADMMALKAEQTRVDKQNAFKDSPLGALSGNGVVLDGFLLSEVLGAGFSLGDFLSPTNIILSSFSVRKEWKDFERNFLFIEVPSNCDEACAIGKLSKIAVEQKRLQYELSNLAFPNDTTVHLWETGMWSRKLKTYHLNDKRNNKILLFSLRNPELFEIGGKRYYGSNPKNDDPTDSRWIFGNYKEDVDTGLYALIKVSEKHPELFTYLPKKPFETSKFGAEKQTGCRGNFIVQNGKIELLYQMFGCLAFADTKNAPPESLIIYQ